MTSSSAATSTVRVSLKEASRRVGVPEMIHFHRLAHRWFLELRRAAVEKQIVPVRIGPHAFDCLDGLRQELNVANGAALASFDLAAGLVEQEPGKNIEIDLEYSDRQWKLVAEVARDFGLPVRVNVPAAGGLWDQVRLPAYRIKRFLQRSVLVPANVPPEPNAILMIPRMPGHLADLLPVASEIRTRFQTPVRFAVVDRRLFPLIRDQGFPVRGLYAVMPSDRRLIRQAINDAGRRLPTLIADLPQDGDRSSRCRRELLKRRTTLVLETELRDVFRTAACVGSLLDEERPSAVVVGNPYTSEGRITVRAAAARGIKTFAIEHGSIFPNDPCWSDCPAEEVYAWGEPSRRALLSCGVDERRIFVTGGPRHDVLFRHPESSSDSSGKTVLVAVSGPGDNISLAEHLRFIDLLFRAADQHRNIDWVVKLHRKDRVEYYRPPAGIPGTNVRVVPADYLRDGRQIFELLRDARVLVTISSTCAVDAMAVDVPVVAVEVWPEGAGIPVEFLRSGACRRVRTADELAAAVARVFKGPPDVEREEAARRYAADHFVNRGRAAETVAERILSHVKPR